MPTIETCLAKPHRWLAVLHARLLHVSEGAGVDCLKLIALLLSFPVFKACDLLFKLRYALGARKLRLISRKQRLLGVQNVLLERDFGVIDCRLRFGTIEALSDIISRFEAAKARTNFCKHTTSTPSR